MVVKIVSENAGQIIGYDLEQLFMLADFLSLLPDNQQSEFIRRCEITRKKAMQNPENSEPEIFIIEILSSNAEGKNFWCALHINNNNNGLIICEFEPEEDITNPLFPAEEKTPAFPENTLNATPTPEALAESSVNAIRPLRILQRARRRVGASSAMEAFNVTTQILKQLNDAKDLPELLQMLISVVKSLSGFHRVLVYQFDQS